MKNEDIELIQRVLAGDENAFSVLVRKYQKQVHALAWRKIGDFHTAEEITQDTFLKAYKKLSTLQKPQRFASWLYVIATNLCSSWLRKKRVQTQPLEALETMDNTQLREATYSGYVSEENERTAGAAQRDVVKKLLAKLPESERTVITLHYFGEMSCTEIGAFLGVSANTVKSRLHRARQHLRKEHSMIKEALDNFQMTPNLTENVMKEIARITPDAPVSGKPIVPWAIAASTLAVILLTLGLGNRQHLTRFQKPYSFDASSEMTIELIEAPLALHPVSKTDARTQRGHPDARNQKITPERNPQESPAVSAEAQTDETAENYAKWALPKEAKARLGKGGIAALHFSPDGTQLAVGSNIGLWLYDAKTGKEIAMFPGICQDVAFSPDGRFIASSGGKSRGQNLHLWEIMPKRKVPISGEPFVGSVVQFSEDGKRLVSLDIWGKTLHQVDVETGHEVRKNIADRELAPGRVGIYALTHDKLAVANENEDGDIQVYDTSTGRWYRHLKGQASPPQQGLKKRLSALLGFKGEELPPHQRRKKSLLALAFSPDGTQLASGSEDTTVRLYNTTNENDGITLRKHTGWTNVLAFSPAGKVLASGSTDKTVQVWNAVTGDPLSTLTGHLSTITALAFSSDGAVLVSGSADGTVRFWNTETGDPLPLRITGHTETVKAVAFSDGGETLASAAFNGIITFWDVKTFKESGRQTASPRDWFTSVAFSPDGTKLAGVGANGDMPFGFGFRATWETDQFIRLTEVKTGHEIAKLTDLMSPSHLTFSPDGKTVAFGEPGKIQIRHTETGNRLTMSLLDPLDPREGHKQPDDEHGMVELLIIPQIGALAFSPDGTKLVSATWAGQIQMWDTEAGIELISFVPQDPDGAKHEVTDGGLSVATSFKDPISVLAFSPNGKRLAAGSQKQIRLWNMGTGNWGKGPTSIDMSSTAALVFSPESTELVSGQGYSGKIHVWDAATGDALTTLNGHTEGIETLQFSPDGRTLVSASQDGTLLLWEWDEIIKDSAGEEEDNPLILRHRRIRSRQLTD